MSVVDQDKHARSIRVENEAEKYTAAGESFSPTRKQNTSFRTLFNLNGKRIRLLGTCLAIRQVGNFVIRTTITSESKTQDSRLSPA